MRIQFLLWGAGPPPRSHDPPSSISYKQRFAWIPPREALLLYRVCLRKTRRSHDALCRERFQPGGGLAGQLAELNPVGLVGLLAEAFFAVFLVFGVVAIKEDD